MCHVVNDFDTGDRQTDKRTDRRMWLTHKAPAIVSGQLNNMLMCVGLCQSVGYQSGAVQDAHLSA